MIELSKVLLEIELSKFLLEIELSKVLLEIELSKVLLLIELSKFLLLIELSKVLLVVTALLSKQENKNTKKTVFSTRLNINQLSLFVNVCDKNIFLHPDMLLKGGGLRV